MVSRRQFILGTGGALGLASLPLWFNQQTNPTWLVSAFSNVHQHFIGAFTPQGQLINAVALPSRGHAASPHPSKPGHAIIFARRPGTYLIEVDLMTARITQRISSPSGYHFYGHGQFSHDGQLLYSVENNVQRNRGEIVIRDSQNYHVIERFDCGGVGPHECKLMPDNTTLVIANGGIKTHPQWPRKKLNLADMSPALTYLDLSNGQIIDHFTLDNHQLSIRHLDVSSQGKVIAGLQYQGNKHDIVPLAISHHGQASLSYLQAPDALWQQLKQYTASVCIDESNNQVAISSPRGNLITQWDLHSDKLIHKIPLRDVAGLSIHRGQMIATNGKGQVANLTTQPLTATHFNNIRWDNHLTTITGV